ncbi:hypothetical protein PoB_005045700 [Plakobranchus ocellatus]|uniref:Uncharacterized protein n=1 Tax=Plakobranchus ocellatus TaxID=259542 RepID=A0AAV4BX87_9GAST|nr:hypothetical protein PoB_005045700 [Plakobranchus ocellatus]
MPIFQVHVCDCVPDARGAVLYHRARGSASTSRRLLGDCDAPLDPARAVSASLVCRLSLALPREGRQTTLCETAAVYHR